MFAIVLAACVVVVVVFIRRVTASIGSETPVAARPQIRYDTGKIALRPIEMKVVGQNPNIGGRNIHPVGTGSRRSVGGGGSTYLIYLYQFPGHIGELTHDGQGFVFVPLRVEFFPDLGGPVHDCLGKNIRLRTKDKREVGISFHEYVSPLDQVNRIMHLIDKPGVRSDGRRGTDNDAERTAPAT